MSMERCDDSLVGNELASLQNMKANYNAHDCAMNYSTANSDCVHLHAYSDIFTIDNYVHSRYNLYAI